MTKQHEAYLLVSGHSDDRGGGNDGGRGSSGSGDSGDNPRKKRLAGTYMLNIIYIVAHPVYPNKLFSVK